MLEAPLLKLLAMLNFTSFEMLIVQLSPALTPRDLILSISMLKNRIILSLLIIHTVTTWINSHEQTNQQIDSEINHCIQNTSIPINFIGA